MLEGQLEETRQLCERQSTHIQALQQRVDELEAGGGASGMDMTGMGLNTTVMGEGAETAPLPAISGGGGGIRSSESAPLLPVNSQGQAAIGRPQA